MPSVHTFLATAGLLSLGFAAGYSLLTLAAVVIWRHRGGAAAANPAAPVTVLKPLCDAEPGLYEHLRTFCLQEYETYQLVFGVRDRNDSALEVVSRLVTEFPHLQIDVVVDSALHGKNYKISNLINMLRSARYDWLVVADSDTWVGPDYLRSVTAPLQDPAVGLVTCVYRGVPTARITSRLGAMYLNEWYMPSVLVSRLLGYQGYASGQTMCLRRDVLESIGGLHAIRNHLADDFRLGELVRGAGLKNHISRYWVAAQHHEPNLRSLIRHELRWMHTLRVLRPRSFAVLFLSFSLPLAVLGLCLSAGQSGLAAVAWGLFGVALAARLWIHCFHRGREERPMWSDFWLLPVRELLMLGVWGACFFTSRVQWRGSAFDVDADGIMR
jgi:ceramide glucosyltransferase